MSVRIVKKAAAEKPPRPPKSGPGGGGGGGAGGGAPNNGGGGGGGGGGGFFAWADLLTQVRGGPAPTVHNVVLILQHDPSWKDTLQYDEFAQRVVFVKDPPTHEYKPKTYTPPKERDGDEAASSQLRRYVGREVTDEDCSRAAVWIERAWFIKISSAAVHEAMEIVARTCSVHPVRQFLSSLSWDGVKRLGKPARAPGTLGPDDEGDPGAASWLTSYLGADDTDYVRSVGRWWLISAIARIFVPGCQAQHMMILEGPQGLGKSRALRALADPWFSEDLPDTTSKDALQQLSGVWMLEVAEMDAINKGGINAAKRFISKATDRYRLPYGRRVCDFPRQVVFCGTTNQTAYLVDTTGNRRYWPVLTRQIDVEGVRANRDQLLAEAVVAFHAGEHWWPDQTQVEMLREQQDDRVEQDAWFGPVSSWLRSRVSMDSGVTVAGLLSALDIDKGRWGPTEERRATRLLLQMGRVRVRREYEGVLQYVYEIARTHAAVEHQPAPAPALPPPDPGPEQGALWREDDPDDDWK